MTKKPRPQLQPGETRAYPVLPLRDIVVFPHMIVPLFVGREKSIKALEEVMRSDTFILLATQKNASDDDPATDCDLRGRDAGERAAAAQAARRHRQGAGRGRHAREGSQIYRPDDYYEADADRDRRRHGRPRRGGSYGALGGHRIRKLCEAEQESVARSGRRDPADRGLRQARRHGRFASGRQDSRQAGHPGDAVRHRSAWKRCSA